MGEVESTDCRTNEQPVSLKIFVGWQLLAVHGRPRFAKHTFIDELAVKIAPVHPGFLAAGNAAVPDGIC
jgi:hypothetical protein